MNLEKEIKKIIKEMEKKGLEVEKTITTLRKYNKMGLYTQSKLCYYQGMRMGIIFGYLRLKNLFEKNGRK